MNTDMHINLFRCVNLFVYLLWRKGNTVNQEEKNFMECEMEVAVVGRKLRLYCSAVVALV